MRTLVGILRYGENEFGQCVSSLKAQTHLDFDFFVIENLPNKAAHDQLYSRFMENAADYEAFLKLDADMVLSHENVLKDMCNEVEMDTSLLFSWVNDIPSSLKIPGIFLFRSDVVWTGSDDGLNVDYAPQINGKGKVLINRDFVNHMPDPAPMQLLRYGVHKALKALQPDRRDKNIKKWLLHMSVLNGIARNYFSGRQRLALSMIGAMLVFSGRIKSIDYNCDENRGLFSDVLSNEKTYASLRLEAEKFWSNEVHSIYRWFDAHCGTVWA